MSDEKAIVEARLVTMEHNGENAMFAVTDDVFEQIDMTMITAVNKNARFVRFNGSPGDGGHFVYGKVVNDKGLELREWCTVKGYSPLRSGLFHVESVEQYVNQ